MMSYQGERLQTDVSFLKGRRMCCAGNENSVNDRDTEELNMNKQSLIAMVGAVIMVAGLAACGSNTSQADVQAGASEKGKQTASVDANAGASIKGPAVAMKEGQHTSSRTAIVYFSEPEGKDMSALQGNTQFVAQVIAEKTGADVFRIEPVQQYPVSHKELVAKAKAEELAGARPELKDTIGDLSQYDTIFLGYPIWRSTMPMPVYSFLESHNLSGKKVIIFSTHGGSGLADTVAQVTEKEPGAQIVPDAYTVSRDDVVNAKDSILSWLGRIGY